MKRSRFTEEQIIGVLKEHQAGCIGSVSPHAFLVEYDDGRSISQAACMMPSAIRAALVKRERGLWRKRAGCDDGGNEADHSAVLAAEACGGVI